LFVGFFRFPSGNVRMLPSLWIVSRPFLPSRIALLPQLPNHKWKMRRRRLISADQLKRVLITMEVFLMKLAVYNLAVFLIKWQ